MKRRYILPHITFPKYYFLVSFNSCIGDAMDSRSSDYAQHFKCIQTFQWSREDVSSQQTSPQLHIGTIITKHLFRNLFNSASYFSRVVPVFYEVTTKINNFIDLLQFIIIRIYRIRHIFTGFVTKSFYRWVQNNTIEWDL